MGYDFYITRKTDYPGGEGRAIRREEWLDLASSLEHFEPVSENVIGELTLKLPLEWHSHRWTAHPEFGRNGSQFRWTGEDLNFRGDDPATLGFALRLARHLKARVVGEEGEEWTLEGLIRSAANGNPTNPFTKRPIFEERAGSLEHRGGEWRLVSRRRTLFGLRSTEDRVLLHFVMSEPEPVSQFDGRKARVRGSLSVPGKYGADASCAHVLYALRVISLEPRS
jgi:hypothetical protein